MLDFREIEIADGERIQRIFCDAGFGGTDASFAELFIWAQTYSSDVCFFEDTMFIHTDAGYFYPYGAENMERALRYIANDARERGRPARLTALTRDMQKTLPNVDFCKTRELFEYIYDVNDMIELSGKKLHSKRNHLNRFLSIYEGEYEFRQMEKRDFPKIDEFKEKWYLTNTNAENACALKKENIALERALKNADELGLVGGILTIDDEICAFTIGMPLCKDTFLIPFEKANHEIVGAYQAINQMFAERFCASYKYINREDDAGDAGLRRAKLSYQPVALLEKYTAEINI